MMSAPTGGKLKVTGRSIAMAASGPMPGSTPTRVPMNTPMKQYIRLTGVTAVLNPRVRLGKYCASSPMSVAPPEFRVGQLQAPQEQRRGAQRQHDGQQHELEGTESADRKRAQDDDQRDRRDEPQPEGFHREPVD